MIFYEEISNLTKSKILEKKLFYANIIYFVSYCFLHARPQSLFHILHTQFYEHAKFLHRVK